VSSFSPMMCLQIPIQQVTNAQKEMVAACNAAGKPVSGVLGSRFALEFGFMTYLLQWIASMRQK
jgi:hypothetical protein